MRSTPRKTLSTCPPPQDCRLSPHERTGSGRPRCASRTPSPLLRGGSAFAQRSHQPLGSGLEPCPTPSAVPSGCALERTGTWGDRDPHGTVGGGGEAAPPPLRAGTRKIRTHRQAHLIRPLPPHPRIRTHPYNDLLTGGEIPNSGVSIKPRAAQNGDGAEVYLRQSDPAGMSPRPGRRGRLKSNSRGEAERPTGAAGTRCSGGMPISPRPHPWATAPESLSMLRSRPVPTGGTRPRHDHRAPSPKLSWRSARV